MVSIIRDASESAIIQGVRKVPFAHFLEGIMGKIT